MTDIKTILNFFSKLTVKDIGNHFSNVALLYTKPFATYRKLVKDEYESYHFFLLFVFYYAFLIFFILDDPKWIIPFTILEIVLTLLPYSFLIIPFLIFKKRYSNSLKSAGLFRLLFVVKLQFGIFLVLALLLAKWSKMESIYVFIDNYSIFIFLPLITALPLSLKPRLKIKLFWIFINYIFSLLYFFLIGLIVSYVPDSEKLYKKIVVNSPTINYIIFQENYNLSDVYLSNQFIAFANEKGHFIGSQFAANPALKEVLRIAKLDNAYNDRKLDSLIKRKEKYWPKELIKHPYLLSIVKMDSLRQDFNKQFYKDLNYVDSLSKSEVFDSNKRLYSKIYRILKYHDSIHKSIKAKQDIIKEENDLLVRCSEHKFVLLYTLKDRKYIELENEIKFGRDQFEKRMEHSSLFANIYLYPLILLSELE